MQFHLDGFEPGDPARRAGALRPTRANVDVLIVGAGPAGLALAAQLAQFPDLCVRLVERKDGPLQLGQADGIACRSMEMFAAYGFAERVMQEGYWVNEVAFWKPDPENPAHIRRSGRVQDVEDGLSEFPHVILNQARIHDYFLEAMRYAPAPLEPDYGAAFVALERPADDGPVLVTLERAGAFETVTAKYVVGCDGARSLVRGAIGQTLKGDSASQAWGVMDLLALTDFPDVRLKTAVQSSAQGSAMIIPREGGYLFRLYIELDKLAADARVSSLNLTSNHLVEAARRIFAPYTFEPKEIVWWSAYEIGQRLTDAFDDSTPARGPRVFIAGDACHTHSPKAGQGMNVSMQDGFNLGWKLVAALRGQCGPAILRSYGVERHAVAQALIDFDREWAAMFSAPPRSASRPDGVDPETLRQYFQRQLRYTAGVETHYAPSPLCAATPHQALARGFPVGWRFHSAPVVRLADARPLHLGSCARADGRWRLYLFADRGGARLAALGAALANHPRFAPTGEPDAVFDMRAIYQESHHDVRWEDTPELFRPRKGRYGLVDYEKIFCPDFNAGDIFEARGVAREGCIVVVRPDQYVAHVLPLDAPDALGAFFDAFMTA